MLAYVINRDGQPLMPCKAQKVRKLLKEGKAKVVRKTPFTIKLLCGSSGYKQEVVGGLDTGSKKLGCAAVTNGKVVYQSEVQLRSDISKKMTRRRMYRRKRRSRKTRYRPARWQNRASMRQEGRLAPSIKSKVDSHFRERDFVESILPVSRWIVETASFDIHKIVNPKVQGKDYQNGPKKGYNDRAYVLWRDGHKCRYCCGKSKDARLHVHHIILRSLGGTDEPNNKLTLCVTCHDLLHAGLIVLKQKHQRSKTREATYISIVKSQLKEHFGSFSTTYGYETKYKRECLGLPKTHYYDAVAICLEEDKDVELSPIVYQKRHVAAGDYQQTKGKHSEILIPTSKLFGLRKFDLVLTSAGKGFIKGKRSTGFFSIGDLDGNIIKESLNIKKNCARLQARSTTLVDLKHNGE